MSLVNSALYPEHVCLTVKTEAQWTLDNPVLMAGEIAICTQCQNDSTLTGFNNDYALFRVDIPSARVRLKAGDGVTRWKNLPFIENNTDTNLSLLANITAQHINDLDTRLKAAEALISQYEELAESMLLYLNSWTTKLEKEEGFN